uniref:Uncharacterized protein n=1 Tax=Trichinella nativa TaxID=6335 RepID=A0A0V1KGU5_9BILA
MFGCGYLHWYWSGFGRTSQQWCLGLMSVDGMNP